MKAQNTYTTSIIGLLIYTAVPVGLYALGSFPRRTLLKESFSLLFLMAFSLMLGLFFLSRSNRNLIHEIRMRGITKTHKFIGYAVTLLFLVHPILLVIPRFFEAGVDPRDAFLEILTSFDNLGIILGMTGWVLILFLGLTSMLRKRLPFQYATWRMLHGITVMLFTAIVTWHVLLLGRHADLLMSIFFLFMAALGILVNTRNYVLQPSEGAKHS